MDDPTRQALREALLADLEPASPEFHARVREAVLLGAAPTVPWLRALLAKYPGLTITGAAAAVAAAAAAGYVLLSGQPVFEASAGYAETAHHTAQGGLPSPWKGDQNVLFVGDEAEYDSGAVRIDNRGRAAFTVDDVWVQIGSIIFRPTSGAFTVPPQGTLIIAGNDAGPDFDTSETNVDGCTQSIEVPVVHLRVNGHAYSFRDLQQVLNTGGVSAENCPGHAEAHAWQPIRP